MSQQRNNERTKQNNVKGPRTTNNIQARNNPNKLNNTVKRETIKQQPLRNNLERRPVSSGQNKKEPQIEQKIKKNLIKRKEKNLKRKDLKELVLALY